MGRKIYEKYAFKVMQGEMQLCSKGENNEGKNDTITKGMGKVRKTGIGVFGKADGKGGF